MSFKIIADILTVPFEGDFNSDMDPSLKKVFGRAKKNNFFLSSQILLSQRYSIPQIFSSGLIGGKSHPFTETLEAERSTASSRAIQFVRLS